MTLEEDFQEELKLSIRFHNKLLSEAERWTNGIAIHFYHLEDIDWKGYHNYIVEELFPKYNLNAHYAQIYGGAFGKLRGLTYRNVKKKLDTLDMNDLIALGIYSVENGKLIQGGDYFENQLTASTTIFSDARDFDYSELVRGIALAGGFFIIDEKIQAFDIEVWKEIASKLHNFIPFEYSYFYRVPIGCHQEWYRKGYDKVSVTVEDYISNYNWRSYINAYDAYLNHPYLLRDLFRLNFLTKPYLALRMVDESSLEEWINKDPVRGTLDSVSDNLYCWHIEEENIEKVRQQMKSSNILLRYFDRDHPLLKSNSPESSKYDKFIRQEYK